MQQPCVTARDHTHMVAAAVTRGSTTATVGRSCAYDHSTSCKCPPGASTQLLFVRSQDQIAEQNRSRKMTSVCTGALSKTLKLGTGN